MFLNSQKDKIIIDTTFFFLLNLNYIWFETTNLNIINVIKYYLKQKNIFIFFHLI